jgi:hypothetical protein
MNMALLAALGPLLIGRDAAAFERQTLRDTRSTLLMLAILAFASFCVRKIVLTLVSREKDALRFEEEPPPELIGLQLNHDCLASGRSQSDRPLDTFQAATPANPAITVSSY